MEDNEDSQLPRGWARSKIMEICNLINGRAFKTSEWSSKGLPIIRIQNLNNPDAEFNCCDFSVEEKYYVNDGQLLFAWSGTPETSFGAHIWRGGKAVLNQHIFKVEIDERFINKAFLMHLMNHNVTQYVRKAHGTAGLAHITKGKFEDSMMPIPPLNEQVRIVRRVEELLACLDAGVEGLQKVKAQLKRYRQAVLKYAFEGKLTEEWRKTHEYQTEPATRMREQTEHQRRVKTEGESTESPLIDASTLPQLPESWVWTRLGDIAEKIVDGSHNPPPKQVMGIPMLSAQNILNNEVVFSKCRYISENDCRREANRAPIEVNDVLLTIVGTIGRSAVVKESVPKFTVQRSVAVIKSSIKAEYLSFLFQSPFYSSYFIKNAKGTAQKGIYLNQLEDLPIVLAPIPEQNLIVGEIESRFSLVDKLQEAAEQSFKQSERLRQSILGNAFEGELVPQDPSDEPAEKLLERIKAERAKSKGEKDTNKGRKNKPKQLELPNCVK